MSFTSFLAPPAFGQLGIGDPLEFRAYRDREFRDPERSPLETWEVSRFKGLNYFNITPAFYQGEALSKTDEYKDYLLIPFTDTTNGKETYGGGRYIDFAIPASEMVTLDFNLAYNPSCAYSSRYSCPIPPRENRLKAEIRAGEKTYRSHGKSRSN